MSENYIGEKIKQTRQQQRMTLKTLAEKTGFSISFLSQLERGKSSTTLESLKKISIAFGVNPSIFFEDEHRDENGILMINKRADQHNIYYKDLGTMVTQRDFVPLLVMLKPGQTEGNLITHRGQEFLYVIEGTLTVQLEEQLIELGPSDSFMIDSTKPHYWYNYTDSEVKLLCVTSEG